MKVLANFLCNGIAGNTGDVLTAQQLEVLGAQVSDLVLHGCLEQGVEPVAVPEEVADDAADEGKKKKSKKKSE